MNEALSIDVIQFRGQTVLFVDMEASSLDQGSYPIEVGWSRGPMESTGSRLIRPTQEWREKGSWSVLSEAVHQIPFAELLAKGFDVMDAAAAADAALEGCLLVSDNPLYEMFWLRMLFDAANRPFRHRVQDLGALWRDLVVEYDLDPVRAAAALDNETIGADCVRHRAAGDARRMALRTHFMLEEGKRF